MFNREIPGFIHEIKVISSQTVILSKLLFSQCEKLRELKPGHVFLCSVQDFKKKLQTQEIINKKKIIIFLLNIECILV